MAERFNRQNSIHQTQAGYRSAEIGIQENGDKAGIVVEEVVQFPKVRPRQQDEREPQVQPNEQENHTQKSNDQLFIQRF